MRGLLLLGLLKRLKYLKHTWAYLKDWHTSWLDKFYLFVGFLYLVSPIDLVPIMVFPFSAIDDSLVLIAFTYYLTHVLKKYEQSQSFDGEPIDFEHAIKVTYEEVKPGGDHET